MTEPRPISSISRYDLYARLDPCAAAGWRLQTEVPSSRLFGSNGIRWAGGRLWITEFNGEQVSTWDPATDEVAIASPMGSPIQGPDDIAFDAAGTFYVTEVFNARVTGRRLDGTHVVVHDEVPNANGITIDPATDTLYIDEMREDGRVLQLDTSGAGDHRVIAEGLSWCNALEMSPAGELCLPQVMDGTVVAVDPSSGSVRTVAEGLATPTAVKFDPSGRMVVAEAGLGVITSIDLQTGARRVVADPGPGIDNFCYDPAGHLYTSSYCEARVEQWDDTGAVTRRLSTGGLMGPYSIAASPAGHLFAADANTVVAVEDGHLRRLSRLLIDQDYVAVGVAFVGEHLLVLSLAGDVFLREPDGTMRTILSATTNATSKMMVAGVGGASAIGGSPHGGAIALAEDGTVVAVGADLTLGSPRATGLRTIDAVATAPGLLVAADTAGGRVVLLRDGAEPRDLPGLVHPQAVAIGDDRVYVVDVSTREVLSFSLDGSPQGAICRDLPVGMPVAGVTHDRRCSLVALPSGELVVGCDGDGSVRRLVPVG